MWEVIRYCRLNVAVAPREGRVSRNHIREECFWPVSVAPREGRVSRNSKKTCRFASIIVAPREGRVSRNLISVIKTGQSLRRAPRGACE